MRLLDFGIERETEIAFGATCSANMTYTNITDYKTNIKGVRPRAWDK